MRRLFGFQKEEEAPKAPAPTLQQASEKIDLKIQDLDAKIAKVDAEVKALAATSSTNPVAKQRALQALKRKKMYEQQRDQLLGTQFNVEQLAFQQETAEVTAVTVQAMKAGTDKLKNESKVTIEEVDDLTAAMEDLAADMQEVQQALAAPTGGLSGVDDSDLADEYARLEEEMAAEALMGGSVGVGTGGYAAATPAIAAPSTDSTAAAVPAASTSAAASAKARA